MTRRKRRKARQPTRSIALAVKARAKRTALPPHWLDRHEAEREMQDERLRKQWARNGEAD